MREAKSRKGFMLIDLLVAIAITAILAALLLPALSLAKERDSMTVCISNLKEICMALNLWHNHNKFYPEWDMPAMTGDARLNPWPDMLKIEYPFDPETLEKKADRIESSRTKSIKAFVKCIDNPEVFVCPSDNPHPSRVNEDRAKAWSFKPYEYSYGISARASVASRKEMHRLLRRQILAGDSNWSWQMNFSGNYLNGAPWNYPFWYSNTTAWRHMNNTRANFVYLDGHIESLEVTFEGSGPDAKQKAPDTKKSFFHYPGEDYNIFE